VAPRLEVHDNVTYVVALAVNASDSESASLEIAFVPGPPNDLPGNATAITSFPYQVNGLDARSATASEGSPEQAVTWFGTLWWKFNVDFAGALKLTFNHGVTCQVWKDSMGKMVMVYDETLILNYGKLPVIEAGTDYYIMTGMRSSHSGDSLFVYLTANVQRVPKNGAIARAEEITSFPTYLNASIEFAPLEPNENPGVFPDYPRQALWWKVTQSSPGRLYVTSKARTTQFFRKPQSKDLESAQSVDDCSDAFQHKDDPNGVVLVKPTCKALMIDGESTYFIGAGAFSVGVTDVFFFGVDFGKAPSHSDIANAELMAQFPFRNEPISNQNATSSLIASMDELHRALWWQFTANQTGRVSLTTIESNFDTKVVVLTSKDKTLLASNDDCDDVVDSSCVEFEVDSGKQYFISVSSSVEQVFGTVRFQSSYVPSSNSGKDNKSNPFLIAGLAVLVFAALVGMILFVRNRPKPQGESQLLNEHL
jgi:hypothetical protein